MNEDAMSKTPGTVIVDDGISVRDSLTSLLSEEGDRLAGCSETVGNSVAMKKVLELVDTVARTDATVLIRGESGTGKELVARAIHSLSARHHFAMVPINCGALPENLLETELFGHERGAFTGAQFHRKGKLETADGGTLFLDEIGTIGMKTQLDLLRVIETKEFCRLGTDKPRKVDFRVVCATNRNLEQAVSEGDFREDFYYRINVFAVHLPPLRERDGDIPLLARHFVTKYSSAMGKKRPAITPEAMELLTSYHWPGNVRELQNAIERAIIVAQNGLVRPADLPFRLNSSVQDWPSETLAAMEWQHISMILERFNWNISRSAEKLGIHRATLHNKIAKYSLRK
jgi:transcriptional regulator with PAS, ATPase and Fis domain